MQLEQSFVVDASQDTVWAAFHDPALLVSCLPGASLRGEIDGEQVPLTFRIKLGPIAAAFAGEGRLVLDETARAGSFAGQAIDARSNSRVKGEASFATVAHGSGTQVAVTVTFTITGSLAQFSREGIVRALGDQLTQQFAANLRTRLGGTPATAPLTEPTQPELPLETAEAGVTATAAASGAAAALPTASAPSARPGQPQPARAAHPAGADAPALNLVSLLRAMLRDYWRRLFKKGRTS